MLPKFSAREIKPFGRKRLGENVLDVAITLATVALQLLEATQKLHQKVGGDTQTGFPKARMRFWEKGETRIALFGIAESNADKQCEFRRVPCTPATSRDTLHPNKGWGVLKMGLLRTCAAKGLHWEFAQHGLSKREHSESRSAVLRLGDIHCNNKGLCP